ncbi:uncharacterized protein LY79DRAFT_246706 [Colletotrichum navitas]|uniref:Uncharacterized protein n=1 Tax=Colletotrichum navitas TaxID=681940 RepID=A0AAD8Q9Q8_9PEZI|nr:uncharacterized protein LY79DRAFT_246706 [Colletotrichum navitas]KAK1598522.1 hypothetical protein LY79DRAFT_246706 [Colletotrichum navitas]
MTSAPLLKSSRSQSFFSRCILYSTERVTYRHFCALLLTLCFCDCRIFVTSHWMACASRTLAVGAVNLVFTTMGVAFPVQAVPG